MTSLLSCVFSVSKMVDVKLEVPGLYHRISGMVATALISPRSQEFAAKKPLQRAEAFFLSMSCGGPNQASPSIGR